MACRHGILGSDDSHSEASLEPIYINSSKSLELDLHHAAKLALLYADSQGCQENAAVHDGTHSCMIFFLNKPTRTENIFPRSSREPRPHQS